MTRMLLATGFPALITATDPLRAVLYNITHAHTSLSVCSTFSFFPDSTVPLLLMPVGALVRVWIEDNGYKIAPVTVQPRSDLDRDASAAPALFLHNGRQTNVRLLHFPRYSRASETTAARTSGTRVSAERHTTGDYRGPLPPRIHRVQHSGHAEASLPDLALASMHEREARYRITPAAGGTPAAREHVEIARKRFLPSSEAN